MIGCCRLTAYSAPDIHPQTKQVLTYSLTYEAIGTCHQNSFLVLAHYHQRQPWILKNVTMERPNIQIWRHPLREA